MFTVHLKTIIISKCCAYYLSFTAPNLSTTEDKARLGAAPPRDYAADPMTDSEKQFYENLPFHGMQNPPNKVRHPSATTPS